MRKILFILLLFLSPGVMWGQITSGDVYVDTDSGSDGASCGTSTGAGACASLHQAIEHRLGTLTGAVTIHCKGAADDTAAVTVTGHGTTATNTLTIKVDTADRHTGVYDGNKYTLSITNSAALTITSENYVTIDGLQIQTVSPSANGNSIIGLSGTVTSGDNRTIINGCLLIGHRSATYFQSGIYLGCNNLVIHIINNIIYAIPANTTSRVIASTTATTVNIYSNTGIGGEYGIRRLGGTLTVKNNYFGGSMSGDFEGTISQTTNASSDATATGTALDSIAVNTTNFTNVTAGSENFLLPGTGSALYNVGTDTSGDSGPLNFTTDIQGGTRSGTWDIGADEYGVDGSTTTTSSTSTAATTSTTTSTAAPTTTTLETTSTSTSTTSTIETTSTTAGPTTTSTTSTTSTSTTTSTAAGSTTTTLRKNRLLSLGVG